MDEWRSEYLRSPREGEDMKPRERARELANRRLRAVGFLAGGHGRQRVARRVGVGRRSVRRCKGTYRNVA